jgi:hypothetical protein
VTFFTRIILYAGALASIFVIAMWLAFGPLHGDLLELFLVPGRVILWMLRPGQGSHPAPDLVGEAMLSFAVWLSVAVAADRTYAVLSRRSRRVV